MNELTEEQLEAVNHEEGPALCIAVPGSGKTHLLTHRFKALIDKGVDPKRVLLCTFSVKAAEQLTDKANDLGIKQKTKIAKTLHSICFRIMKAEWKNVKALKYFKANDFHIARPSYFTNLIEKEDIKFSSYSYFSAWERWKDFGKINELANPFYKDTWEFWEFVQRKAEDSTPATFGDLLCWTKELFEANEEVAFKWSNIWDYILLDEAQDTSSVQWDILNVFNKENNLMAVGDDNQSIYSFRAANLSSFVEFSKQPGCHLYTLSKNFRSHQKITELSDKLMKNYSLSIKKQMVPYKLEGPDVKFLSPDSPEQEAYYITKLIDPNKIASTVILARTNSLLEPFERALLEKGYPFKRAGGAEGFYKLPWIAPILRMLTKYQEGTLSNKQTMILSAVPQNPSGLIYEIVEGKIGLKAKFTELEEDSTPNEDWTTMIQVATNYSTLEEYLRIILPLTQAQQDTKDAVTLSTTHRAKGLEWDTVFCIGIVDGFIPHSNAEDIDEERRILYVMVSRAEEKLIISSPKYYAGKPRDPSRFIQELNPKFEDCITDEIYE